MRKLFLMVCLCMSVLQIWAQGSKTITGRITDEKGVPLSGATVFVNDRLAKQTDSDGGYSIVVPAGTTKFTVSYIGFATKEVDLGNKNQINVA
ncbi:MAG: hypothetical protein FGM46_09905, partial [Ferruginibacter sp.]|nr:hypothetical protein [Ferruginibacter sp.]